MSSSGLDTREGEAERGAGAVATDRRASSPWKKKERKERRRIEEISRTLFSFNNFFSFEMSLLFFFCTSTSYSHFHLQLGQEEMKV